MEKEDTAGEKKRKKQQTHTSFKQIQETYAAVVDKPQQLVVVWLSWGCRTKTEMDHVKFQLSTLIWCCVILL